MKKTVVNLMIGLILISSSAFAKQPDAFISESYAKLTDNLASIVQMSNEGTISAEQTVLMVDMQLNAFKMVSLTDEGLHGRTAQFKSASIGCFSAGIVAKLKAGVVTAADVLNAVRDAQSAGVFPACGAAENGSERGK